METTGKPSRAIFVSWRGYFFAILLVVLATWFKYLAQPKIIPTDIPILYILAIVLTATFFGLGPSVLSCVLSLVAYDFFFLPPVHTFTFNIEVVPVSSVFFFVGVLISYLSSNLRKKSQEAKKEIAVRKQNEAELISYREKLEREISEHEQSRKMIDAEKQRFNDVLESLPVYVVLLSPDYHVPFANRFFRERFGESHGKRCFEYLFHRTEPCEICETYTVLKTRTPHHWEWVGPDNHNYDISDFPFTDVDGSPLIMEVGIDVTEQKRAQESLRKARAELETRVQERTRELSETRDYLDNLFNYANAPIIVWNPDFEITRFNHAFERLTGRTADEVLGGKLDILFPEDSHDESMTHIREATSGERWEVVEIPIKHKDGTVRILLWNSANLYAQDGKTVIATIAQGQDITERKKAEDALMESENLMHAFFDSPGVMRGIVEIVDDTTVRHIADNHVTASFMGLTSEALRNKLSSELGEPPEIIHTWVNHYKQSLKSGKSVNFEYQDQRGDHQAWLSATVSYLLTAASGQPQFAYAVLNITERKQAEEALRETRDYLDNLFNYANAPIIVWNPDFEITRFNHAFERLTGRNADEVLGVKLDILFPDDSHDESMRHIHKATSGERWEVVEIPIKHKDGTVRILLWNSANLYARDGKTVIATIAQGQDITERKKSEQLKDEFIGLVSHELRTPMTVITGSLRTAMSDGISLEDKEILLQNAIEGAGSLSAILENLLELSRYQADRLQIHTETVNIPDIANSVIEKLKERSEDRTFLLDFPDKLPPVQADPVRVERILYNLVENAVKYSPEKSVIKVFARKEKTMVVIGVADKGIGISPEDRGRIFELFERLGKSRSQGLGLGLVVCKRLVEAQGGQIWVESEPGQGSTFYFTLPMNGKMA
jgi:PAS domain S-box-containing protein